MNKNSLLLDQYGNPIKRQATPKAYLSAYDGTESKRILADMTTVDYTANQAIASAAERLRARARNLERNNDIVRRALYLIEQNVIGHGGVKLVPTVPAKTGKSLDRIANETIAAEWAKLSRQNDIRKRYQSLRKADKMAVRRRFADGETFIELMPGFQNGSRFSFRFIDPSFIPLGLYDEQRNILMGVELDEWQVPVAYYVQDTKNGEVINNFRVRRVPAERMLHFYSQERPGQVRGVTQLASPMERLHMLDQYEEATLVGARIASSKMGFFYDEINDDSPTEYTGAADDEAADVDPETGRPVEEENLVDIEAGQFEDIGNKRFTAFDPGYPPARYDEYTTSVLRSICAGLNISYHRLSGDLSSVNYSTAREARLDDTDHWRDQQIEFQDAIKDPMFEAWLNVQILKPEFSRWRDTDVDRLTQHRWQFRGWEWIDPEKGAKAAILEVKLGKKSPSQIVDEAGGDFKQVIDQTEADLKYAEDRGIDLRSAIFEPKQEPAQPEPEQGNEE